MNTKNITIINKEGRFFIDYIIDIFNNKFLIYELLKKDFKIAYAQTLLGPLFFILVPIAQSLVFTFLTNNINIKEINGLPTFLFFLLSTTIWNFIYNSAIKCSSVLLANRKLISKIYFNRIIFFVVSILISLIHFIVSFVMLLIVLFLYKFYYNNEIINLSLKIFILPFVILLASLFSFSVGVIFASASVKYRDFVYGLPFIFQMLMFLSPVLYSIKSVNGFIYNFVILNPTTSILELFRYIFINDYDFSFNVLYLNTIQIFILLLVGMCYFRFIDKKISDLI